MADADTAVNLSPDPRDVRVAELEACPTCGGPVTEGRDHEQFVVDIPPLSRA